MYGSEMRAQRMWHRLGPFMLSMRANHLTTKDVGQLAEAKGGKPFNPTSLSQIVEMDLTEIRGVEPELVGAMQDTVVFDATVDKV